MAKERGSALVAMVALYMLVVALQCEQAQAATYVVGDDKGWTFKVAGWEKGKNFTAGDILVFNYPKGKHNVVAVGKAGYALCRTSSEDKVYTSGKDQITLVKGDNNFICGYDGHCPTMRIEISAS